MMVIAEHAGHLGGCHAIIATQMNAHAYLNVMESEQLLCHHIMQSCLAIGPCRHKRLLLPCAIADAASLQPVHLAQQSGDLA